MESSSSSSTKKEQTFLDNFFLAVVLFDYDKAKDITEKERDNPRHSSSPTWQLLMASLVQLCTSEKSYSSLTFLSSKGFLRKDSALKAHYESLRHDFHKIEEGDGTASNGDLEQLLAHLCGQLGHFVSARLELMDFYEKITNVGLGRHVNFEDVLAQIQQINLQYQKNFHHPLLGHLKSVFTFECESLVKLIEAQMAMQQWSFLSSLLHLHEAHAKLGAWEVLLQPKENRRTLSLIPRTQTVPPLYQWLWRLKAHFVSKFSLYFHDVLSKQTSTQEMKMLSSKCVTDFYAKMLSFHRKMDAKCIALVFDASNCEQYRGPGYRHPDRPWEPPQGMETYPAVVCHPVEKPSVLWPNVVMIISDRAHELNIIDRIFCFYDKGSQVTYFLIRVEPRMTLVVIFDTKKSEKDSYISTFMTNFANDLRCNRIFSCLKPGSK